MSDSADNDQKSPPPEPHSLLAVLRPEDLASVRLWRNDTALARQIAAQPGTFSDAEIAQWFDRNSQDAHQLLRGIYLEGVPLAVGLARLMFIDEVNQVAELGLYLGDPTTRGRGVGRRAVDALLREGFGRLKLERIHLRVLEDNIAAIRTYEACGFRHEGRWRAHIQGDDKRLDMLLMGILRAEFMGRTP